MHAFPARTHVLILVGAFIIGVEGAGLNSLWAQATKPATSILVGDEIEFERFRGQKQKGEVTEVDGDIFKVKLGDGKIVNVFAITITSHKPIDRGESRNREVSLARRVWTDSSGEHKLDADLLGVSEGQVRLRKTDGKVITMPLDKLSAADQKTVDFYVRNAGDLAKIARNLQQPHQRTQIGSPGLGSSLPGGSSSLSNELSPLRYALARVSPVELKGEVAWSAAPEGVALKPREAFKANLTVDARATGIDYDSFGEPLFDASRNCAWIVVAGSGGDKGAHTRLERIDLTTGKLLPPIELPHLDSLCAIDPASKVVVTKPFAGDFNIWAINGDSLQLLKKVALISTVSAKEMQFVSTRHLLVRDQIPNLYLWDLKTPAVVYWLQLVQEQQDAYAISPGGKWLAIGRGTDVWLLNAVTGEKVGKFASRSNFFSPVRQLAFDSTGHRLAAVSDIGVHCWSMVDGSLERGFDGVTMPAGEVSFGPDEQLIIGHTYSFSLARGFFTAWFDPESSQNYGALRSAGIDFRAVQTFADEEWLVQRDSDDRIRLLHSPLLATETRRKIAAIRDTDLLTVAAGSKVAIEVDLPLSADAVERIRASLSSKVTANGWTIADVSAADFVVSATSTESFEYDSIVKTPGSGAGQVSTKVRPREGFVKVQTPRDKRAIWTCYAYWSPPESVDLTQGQRLEDAIKVAPDEKFYLQASLPKQISIPRRGKAFLSLNAGATGYVAE